MCPVGDAVHRDHRIRSPDGAAGGVLQPDGKGGFILGRNDLKHGRPTRYYSGEAPTTSRDGGESRRTCRPDVGDHVAGFSASRR